MINKIFNNKLYICSIGLLCVLTYLLNYCPAIYQCAAVFTVIVIIINASTSIYGRTKTIKGLAIALITSFALLWKLPYYIDGKIINGLVLASFSSVMISLYLSTSVFQKLTSKFSFVKSNFFSLSVAAIIDGLVMGLFFIVNNNFSYLRVLDIFSRELSYKMMYGLVASAIILTTLNIFKNNKKLGSNLKITN